MLQINGARAGAIVTAGIIAGWLIASDNTTKLAHYKTIAPDALLNEMINKTSGGLPGNIIGAVVLIGIVVIFVDLVTRLYDAVWAKLQPGK